MKEYLLALITKFDLTKASLDVYYSKTGGLFRPHYDRLISALRELITSKSLPRAYEDNVVHPLINFLLEELSEDEFNKIFSTHLEDLIDERQKNIQYYLPILAEALLQRDYESRYDKPAFKDLLAFQAIVNTIYAIAVNHMPTPVPPLVAWNRIKKGPFTIPEEKIQNTFQKISIGVVCLPPEYRTRGLFAWSVMGHEVAGHHLIQSKSEFLDELVQTVKRAIQKRLKQSLEEEKIRCRQVHIDCLLEYWIMPKRVEEVASDILGVLSTGPSIALGTIGYFRGLSENGLLKVTGPFETRKRRPVLHIYSEGQAKTDLRLKHVSGKVKFEKPQGTLGSVGEEKIQYQAYKILSDEHPIEALRPFLMARALSQSSLPDKLKRPWIDLITGEVISKEFAKEKNITIVKINPDTFPPEREEIVIPFQVAHRSIELIADAITTTNFQSLGNNKITEIFNWTRNDEMFVESVRDSYKNNKKLPAKALSNHIVAAAVIEGCSSGADLGDLFKRMKRYLAEVAQKT